MNNLVNKIFIAIPNPGTINIRLAINLIGWTHDPRYVIKIYMPSYISPLPAVRNLCVKEFLISDCGYIWWIDDDVIPPQETLHRLVSADKDAIGAVCFSIGNDKDDYRPYPITLKNANDGKYKVYYGENIEEVDAVGGGCVMVKRKVYEMLEPPYYEDSFDKDGILSLTGDFRIWQKTKEKGFKLWIDFNLLCEHNREVNIKALQDFIEKVENGK